MRDHESGSVTSAQIGLITLFMTALATAQLTASKILAFGIPLSLPATGDTLILPGAAVAYALTYFASDCYSELYGPDEARRLVNTAFVMNFVLLALVWSTILAPAARSSVDPHSFAAVLGASTNIVVGSLLAYIVSQNWDVFVFHRIREYTNGSALWLRNIGSTATSQLIDTVIFVSVAFWVMPRLIGIGPELPGSVILGLLVGQYLLKLLIAILDTPFVYAVVRLVRGANRGGSGVPHPSD